MIIYEIVNQSDMCTFVAPDRDVALAVVALVGEGMYAAKPLTCGGARLTKTQEDELYVPMFFGGGAYETWWRDEGFTSEPLETILKDRKSDTIAALRSCAYGGLEDRLTYDAACAAITDPVKLDEFKRGHEDRRRSSMNRIVQRAWVYADRLKKKEAA